MHILFEKRTEGAGLLGTGIGGEGSTTITLRQCASKFFKSFDIDLPKTALYGSPLYISGITCISQGNYLLGTMAVLNGMFWSLSLTDALKTHDTIDHKWGRPPQNQLG